MWKAILQLRKAIFSVISILFCGILYGQQNIIADKDNTHPEVSRQFSSPARIVSFSAAWNNGYNEIQWSAIAEQDTRKFILEYSADGINFQTAGEVLVTEGNYMLKHYTFDIRPLLYRLRIEDMNGKYVYSRNFLLDGIEILPVKIYPTVLQGNVVNVIADFPVERITIFSGSGQEMYVKEVGGKRDYMNVTLPTLAKGLYWMNFTGQGWKATTKFIIP